MSRRTDVCRCLLDGVRCIAIVAADEPFCPSCEDRHPDLPPGRTTAVPLPMVGAES